MKALRRSIKGDKHESKFSVTAIQPKSLTAIVAPKAVIRALYDYEAQTDRELSFQKGDFFHVLSREDSEDWYEACNPAIPDARGLVPAKFFEKLGKSQRDRESGKSDRSIGSGKEPAHDSGYSDGPVITSPISQQQLPISPQQSIGMKSPASARLSSGGKRTMGSVLARLDHAFEADNSRPEHDEISRDVGDMVLIVAVSTPEWVVAKPAGPKGGGHGLLPLAFVSLLDMRTHQPLSGDPLEIIQREMVPPVDVWKTATAAYKNSCIELGKIGPSSVQQQQAMQAMEMQQSMQRMSLQQQQQSQQFQSDNRSSGQLIADREAELSERAKLPQGRIYFKDPGQEEIEERSTRYPLRMQMQNYARLFSPPSTACIFACVTGVHYEEDYHAFILNVAFEDGGEFELWRTYENFFKFQVLLKDSFPAEAGEREGKTRTLPFMPGPLPRGESLTEAISIKRRENLDNYVRRLLEQPAGVARSVLVTTFFSPQNGFDRRIPPNKSAYSQDSQRSSYGTPDIPNSRQSSQGNLNGGYGGLSAAPIQQQYAPQNGYSNGNGFAPDGRQPQNSYSTPSNNSQQDLVSQPQAAAMKVKVYFGDDLFAIRVPGDIVFNQLYTKICDRCKIPPGDEVELSYKDEPSGEKPLMVSDNDLNTALSRNEKLIIYVTQLR